MHPLCARRIAQTLFAVNATIVPLLDPHPSAAFLRMHARDGSRRGRGSTPRHQLYQAQRPALGARRRCAPPLPLSLPTGRPPPPCAPRLPAACPPTTAANPLRPRSTGVEHYRRGGSASTAIPPSSAGDRRRRLPNSGQRQRGRRAETRGRDGGGRRLGHQGGRPAALPTAGLTSSLLASITRRAPLESAMALHRKAFLPTLAFSKKKEECLHRRPGFLRTAPHQGNLVSRPRAFAVAKRRCQILPTCAVDWNFNGRRRHNGRRRAAPRRPGGRRPGAVVVHGNSTAAAHPAGQPHEQLAPRRQGGTAGDHRGPAMMAAAVAS